MPLKNQDCRLLKLVETTLNYATKCYQAYTQSFSNYPFRIFSYKVKEVLHSSDNSEDGNKPVDA